MAESNTKIIYDEEEDALPLTKSRKVQASIEIGDFIMDVDTNGYISGIEINNASENLKLSVQQLITLQKASMIVNYKPNYVVIYLVMQLENITIPLTVDLSYGDVKVEKTNFVMA